MSDAIETNYQINDQTVVVTAIPMGKLKGVLNTIPNLKGDHFVDLFGEYLVTVLDQGKNPFLNREWIANNISVPEAKRILSAFCHINGLPDFFAKTPGLDRAPMVTRDLEETPTLAG